MPDGFKTITLSPLTGMLDTRSTADQQAVGAFAWKQNVEVSPDGKLRQAHGFQKPYNINNMLQAIDGTPCPYQNWDWHNQGLDDLSLREPIMTMFSSTSNTGAKKLILATKTRIMSLDEAAGSWTEIGNSFGADGVSSKTTVRFRCAELQNKIFFTNNHDKVQYHELGSSTVQEVASLNSAAENGGAITAAAVIIQYQGVIMLMNVVENGTRLPSRIWWSDLNDGTQFNQPDNSSISDFQDLDYGEIILNAIPLGGYIYVFTNKSIWKCQFNVDVSNPDNPQAVLTCAKFYTEPRNQSKCLAYPNTLVSDGFSIFYAARDAVYALTPYIAEPERTEWIYRATAIAFEGDRKIDSTSCGSPVMELRPDTKEIFFSWSSVDAELNSWGSCSVPPPPLSSGINRHTIVLNTQYQTADYRDHGFTAMVNHVSGATTSNCPQQPFFFAASGVDYCIKEVGVGYAREVYDPATGNYSFVGYTPMIRGVFPFGKFDSEKIIKSFKVEGSVEKDAGNVFSLRVGTSFQQMNPNEDASGCGVIWHQLSTMKVKCLFNKTKTQYVQANIRPGYDHEFNFYYRGKFLYYELSVLKSDGTPPVDGGVLFSRFETKAIQA